MRIPDFYLVGAPKCGTTAMNQFLSQHPEIFIPSCKEFHYFGSDLELRNYSISKQEYLSYFQEAGSEQLAGEASVYYLMSKCAAKEIKALNADSRIIAMLRDPMDMIPSQHSQLLRAGNEFIVDLDEALDAEPERRTGSKLPPKGNKVMNKAFFYSEIARYSEQVERYFKTFGRKNVHIILYEDFKKDPASIYRGILEFLGVDSSFQPEFSYINTNRQIKILWLWQLIKFPPQSLRQIWRTILPNKVRGSVLRRLSHVYSKKGSREKLPENTSTRLQAMYSDDVKQLESILGRDLSCWLGGIRDEQS